MRATLYVLAASYDDVDDALADYEAIEVAYGHVSSSHDFDATVVAKDESGTVEIVRRHDEPVRHPPEMAAPVTANATRAKSKVRASADLAPQQLADDVRAAEAKGAATPSAGS